MNTIVQSEREVPDPLAPFARDESESKELALVLLPIEWVPFLIRLVGKGHGTYAREWENVEGGLGEVGAPGKVVDEEMKGEVQLMGRGRCAAIDVPMRCRVD
jgi:hypothetical protein